jgi:hypothetical protein
MHDDDVLGLPPELQAVLSELRARPGIQAFVIPRSASGSREQDRDVSLIVDVGDTPMTIPATARHAGHDEALERIGALETTAEKVGEILGSFRNDPCMAAVQQGVVDLLHIAQSEVSKTTF